MISPIQTGKTYGVLHTESFFSFLGFAKKVGSDETQKIDVFLDDKLIDTIEANKFIQKIDDMYDVESKAFTYNLPLQYIGKKAIISFISISSNFCLEIFLKLSKSFISKSFVLSIIHIIYHFCKLICFYSINEFVI